MPNVFTIFNHGTDFHRDTPNPQEVITQLHTATVGPEAQFTKYGTGPTDWALSAPNPTYLICEGPGSSEIQDEFSSSGKKHAHPGKLNPIFNENKGNTPSDLGIIPKGRKKFIVGGEREYTSFQKDFSGDTKYYNRTVGRVFGQGWDDNVYKAVYLITHLQGLNPHNKAPDVVNIVGWSRGAVTCLKMANKFYEVYGCTIRINIFAIDPVIGGLTWKMKDMATIPPNVLNYLCILAMDDDRSNFQPTDRKVLRISIPGIHDPFKGLSQGYSYHVPNVQFIPLPGNHSDIVNAGKTFEAEASGKLCLHLAWKFLSNHGTTFVNTSKTQKWDMDTSEIRYLYRLLGKNIDVISKKSSNGVISSVGGKRKTRDVRKKRQRYVRGSNLFLNEHHRMCCVTPTIQPQQPTQILFQDTLLKPTKKETKRLPYSDLYQMGIYYDR